MYNKSGTSRFEGHYSLWGTRRKDRDMKATVLVDNMGTDALKGEWGLCIYIEYGEKKILLDAGSSGLFAENAKKLGLSLEDIDYGVLSHAHYDHGNGMVPFFRLNDRAKFYLQDACGENCYSQKWIFRKYIGLPRGILHEYRDRIVLVAGDCTIADGIWLVPHKTPGLSKVGEREKMYLKGSRGWRPDDFSHEQSLVFDTPKGLVIFNSCSHGGADRIITEVLSTFPDKRAFALIGGFHLFHKSGEEVRAFAKRVSDTGIEAIYTGHCTGNSAYGILREVLGERARQFKVGFVMEF